MIFNRIIPTLLLSRGRIVKGQNFKNHRYVGDPTNIVKIFNDKEVDELIILDIDASGSNADIDFECIKALSEECFMPLCYGGGISNIEQARKIFSIGVEKVCLQSSALSRPELISEIASEFGNQSVVVSIDITTSFFGKYQMYHAVSRSRFKESWLDHARKCVDLGAGEVLITSVKHEGLLRGIDINLIKEAAANLSVPVIAGGGISSLDDIKLALQLGASAVSIGSFFVFHGPHRAVLVNVPSREIIESTLGEI